MAAGLQVFVFPPKEWLAQETISKVKQRMLVTRARELQCLNEPTTAATLK